LGSGVVFALTAQRKFGMGVTQKGGKTKQNPHGRLGWVEKKKNHKTKGGGGLDHGGKRVVGLRG